MTGVRKKKLMGREKHQFLREATKVDEITLGSGRALRVTGYVCVACGEVFYLPWKEVEGLPDGTMYSCGGHHEG